MLGGLLHLVGVGDVALVDRVIVDEQREVLSRWQSIDEAVSFNRCFLGIARPLEQVMPSAFDHDTLPPLRSAGLLPSTSANSAISFWLPSSSDLIWSIVTGHLLGVGEDADAYFGVDQDLLDDAQAKVMIEFFSVVSRPGPGDRRAPPQPRDSAGNPRVAHVSAVAQHQQEKQ